MNKQISYLMIGQLFLMNFILKPGPGALFPSYSLTASQISASENGSSSRRASSIDSLRSKEPKNFGLEGHLSEKKFWKCILTPTLIPTLICSGSSTVDPFKFKLPNVFFLCLELATIWKILEFLSPSLNQICLDFCNQVILINLKIFQYSDLRILLICMSLSDSVFLSCRRSIKCNCSSIKESLLFKLPNSSLFHCLREALTSLNFRETLYPA